MKISFSTHSPSSTRRRVGSSAARTSEFSAKVAESPAFSSDGPGPVADIQALVLLQGDSSPSSNAAPQNETQRGHEILDRLEDLRLALLDGTLSRERLLSLRDLLKRDSFVLTPEVQDIIDEIELRAAVELAKRGIYLEG